MGLFNFGPKKTKVSSVKQSYWKKSPSRVPLWKQKNDDNEIGEDKEKNIKEEAREDWNEGRVIRTEEGLTIKGTKVFG